ncbi:MAG: PAS domain S-box protein [Planctomycetota bacterium]
MKEHPGPAGQVRPCEQSPRLFELAIESLCDAVFIIDADSATICHCNPAAAELFGYTSQEMVGRTMDFLYPDPETAARFHKRLHSAAGKTEALLLRGWRMKRKDGATFPTKHTLTPIDDESGRRIAWASVVCDRTEHKRKAAAIGSRDALMGALLENLPLDFWARDAEMRCIMQSRISKQRWGDLHGKSFEEQGQDRRTLAVWRENNRRALAGETIRGDVDVVDIQGNAYHCHNILAPITVEGRITGILGVNVDMAERKRMEDALRAGEEKYRGVFEMAPDGILIVNRRGVILSCNHATSRITGYPENELVGKHFSKIGTLRIKDIPKYMKLFVQVIGGHIPEPFVADAVRKNGSPHSVEVRVNLLGNGMILAMITDITERKRMEDALRASEEKYRTVFAASPDFIYLTDTNGNIIDANPALLKGVGMSLEEIRRTNVRDFYAGENIEELNEVIRRARKGEEIRGYEVVANAPGSKKRVYQVNVVPLTLADGEAAILSVARDITERKRAEEELQKFKTIFDNANYGMAMAEMDGTLIYVNEYFAQVHGYRPEELVGKNLSVFHTREQMKQVTAINEGAKKAGGFGALEVWHKHRDGSVFPMLMNVIVIRDNAGKPSFLAATATDITEREAARKEARDLSQKIITLQEDLLSDISRDLHDEIGQLLTAIDFEVETARRAVKAGKGLPPDGLDRIKEVTRSAVGAVRGLCASLRSPVIKDLGLLRVMEAHVNDFRARTGIDVEFTCSLKRSGVSPDAALGLFRIMQEALTNVARHAEARQVSVSLCRDNGRTVLEISDDGRGFDVDSPPPHRNIGLRGMRERARTFGGEFAIESKPGSGTRIRVSPPPLSGEEAPL